MQNDAWLGSHKDPRDFAAKLKRTIDSYPSPVTSDADDTSYTHHVTAVFLTSPRMGLSGTFLKTFERVLTDI